MNFFIAVIIIIIVNNNNFYCFTFKQQNECLRMRVVRWSSNESERCERQWKISNMYAMHSGSENLSFMWLLHPIYQVRFISDEWIAGLMNDDDTYVHGIKIIKK
jgi:hypothetical protein